jgi:hypothetical protein
MRPWPGGELLAFIEVNPTTGIGISVLRMSDRNAVLVLARNAEAVPGFRSRCVTPFLCALSSASAISMAYLNT